MRARQKKLGVGRDSGPWLITPAATEIVLEGVRDTYKPESPLCHKHKTPHQGLAEHMAQTHAIDAVLARCSAAHREALEQTSSAAVAASQDAARKHERSQRVAIARCLRRSVDTATEAVELVAVAPTSYGATTDSTAPKPGRRRAKDTLAVVAD